MLASLRHFSVILLLLTVADCGYGIADNDLAKTCRPINRPVDVLFIIDGSGSVVGNTFDMQLNMLQHVVNLANVNENSTQIAVIQYSSYTFVEMNFNTYHNKDDISKAVKLIRHKSGTTKTGKALEKAYQLFTDPNTGARRMEDVARVAIVVSDGHSHDDPVPKANRLRSLGVSILALGIGPHIAVRELKQITANPEMVFSNLTLDSEIKRFTTTFKNLAIGEECAFAKSPDGAEITCDSDSFSVSVLTENPFEGRLFVEGEFQNSNCSASSTSTEVTLKAKFSECNAGPQFTVNPEGFFFESKVILQFHPFYSTAMDKTFAVKCFYPVKKSQVDDNTVAKMQSLIQEMPPCSYSIKKSESTEECGNTNVLSVGDKVIHSWSCQPNMFDAYHSILIHSCSLKDAKYGQSQLLIDEQGCSLDESIIQTPVYDNPFTASSQAIVVMHPDEPLVKLRCAVRFCDRLIGECDDLLPPRCNRSIGKRQSSQQQPKHGAQIVTFDQSQQTKTKSFIQNGRRVSAQSVSVSVGTRNGTQLPQPTEIKVNSDSIRLVNTASTSTSSLPSTTTTTAAETTTASADDEDYSTTTTVYEYEEYSVEVETTSEESENTDATPLKSNEAPENQLEKNREVLIHVQKKRKENAFQAFDNSIQILNPELLSKWSKNTIYLESEAIPVVSRKTKSCRTPL